MTQRYKYTFLDAKDQFTLLSIYPLILGPILSYIIFKVGKRALINLISVVVLILTFSWMRIMPPKPSTGILVCFFNLSIYYLVYGNTIWSGISLVVPTQGVAVAYALLSAGYSLFLSISSLYFGNINVPRTVQSYNESLSSLITLSFVLLGVSVAILLVDLKTGGKLHYQENDEKVLKSKEKCNQKFRDYVNSAQT